MTLDNRTNIINNLHTNLGRKLAEKLSFKSPFHAGNPDASAKPKSSYSGGKAGSSVSRKALNQVLTKILPQSATNAASKYKPFAANLASYHEGALNRSLKQHHSVDLKEHSQKSFRKNNLSLNVEQAKAPAFAYGFSQGQTSPVDKM